MLLLSMPVHVHPSTRAVACGERAVQTATDPSAGLISVIQVTIPFSNTIAACAVLS